MVLSTFPDKIAPGVIGEHCARLQYRRPLSRSRSWHGALRDRTKYQALPLSRTYVAGLSPIFPIFAAPKTQLSPRAAHSPSTPQRQALPSSSGGVGELRLAS